METTKKIIRDTIKSLSAKDIKPTPSHYEKEFQKQAKSIDYDYYELKEFDTIYKTLSEEEQLFIRENNISTFYELVHLLLKRVKNKELIDFINHINYFLVPSIDHTIEDRIDILKEELKSNPQKLIRNSTISRLRKFTNERISRDKVVVQEKAKDVKKVISLMGKYFDKCILQSNDTTKQLHVIKEEIETLELSKHSVRDLAILQGKLIDSIYKIEHGIESTQRDLFKGQKDCVYLHKEINKLQNELDKVTKEKDLDFLTGINNRRSFISNIDKIENEYEIFKSKYAIVFYDIDHFKSINDKYGFECGDTILSTFATILKKLTREEDVVCRYTGEKFVSLVHYTEENEAIEYLKRVKNIISTNKFVHKDIKLKVQFCATMAFRNKYNNYKEAIEYAEALMNKAKHEGRNKIILDSGLCL
ncbi:GGDEF domain-containing protein [Arcobacter sp. CECT 8985]|uniref:GGDEF domain-containing protein n=1 Tax=Arcobacter sp. CECT 8985 TaxID=1935424 RepID=UPI00100A8161|nr:GGDEF domain-containing protein [Arcobacter sp. CECT 8985]RXJ87003.1 GGDEF domain-containing protein [Arcobacter sp. CECT 8985]